MSGWLVVELKDFLSLGGWNNILAFGLLKIGVILTLMAIGVGILLVPQITLKSFDLMKDDILKKVESSTNLASLSKKVNQRSPKSPESEDPCSESEEN